MPGRTPRGSLFVVAPTLRLIRGDHEVRPAMVQAGPRVISRLIGLGLDERRKPRSRSSGAGGVGQFEGHDRDEVCR